MRKKSVMIIGKSGICFLLIPIFIITFHFAALSWAEEKPYPNRPINMIVPFGVASGADLGSKIVSEKVSEFLGQPLVSVYKPGGGGSLGASFAAKAKPDGYTVLVGSGSPLILAPIVKKLDYTMDDFVIAGNYSKIPLWLTVKKDARWATLKDFVEEAKKSSGQFMVSTYGKLTQVDFILELLNKYAGIKLVNVPYKSSGEALTALLGGHAVAAMVAGASGHLESGSVRILAVAEEQRLDGLPDVPTFKDCGYPIVMEANFCFCFPKGTPQEIVNRFSDAIRKAAAKYGKEIKADLRKVEQWTDFRSPEETQKGFKAQEEPIYKMAQELGVAVK